ncbi:MAG: transcriptional regulator [Acidobacteria bacterium]|nr:transcriptional regulator [Acidobacteriota bacterium]
MPLYEYQCDACGHRFEQIRKFSDSPLEACPSCGGVVRKLVSSPAIQFKGTGWYVTDYAKKGTSGTEASDAGKSTDGSTSDSSGSSSDSSSSSKTESSASKKTETASAKT